MNACLLKAEPKPLKVNPELISTTHCGLPRAELSNQTPAAQATATSKFGLYFIASKPMSNNITYTVGYKLYESLGFGFSPEYIKSFEIADKVSSQVVSPLPVSVI